MSSYKSGEIEFLPGGVGVRFIETKYARAFPSGKPFTDDTREMIDHFRELGLINMVPSAYTLGRDNTIFIHPILADQLRKQDKSLQEVMAKSTWYPHL